MYCVGFAERTLWYRELNPLSKGSFWMKDLAMRRRENSYVKRKGPREKSATNSEKQKVTGRRRRGPRLGCSEKSCIIQ